MKIIGVENLTTDDLNFELSRGGKFIVYQYCISAFIITFKRSSDIYFIKSGESSIVKGLKFVLVSLLVGWWGFPWGPIYTIQTVLGNLCGGKDITNEVIAQCNK